LSYWYGDSLPTGFDSSLDMFYDNFYMRPIKMGEWETLIVVIDTKLRSISFQFSSGVFSTRNEHFIQVVRGNPVLRWVVHDLGTEVIIKNAKKEKYSICFWILTHASKNFFESLDGRLSCACFPNGNMLLLLTLFVLLLIGLMKNRTQNKGEAVTVNDTDQS
jgi:hypothetical protein